MGDKFINRHDNPLPEEECLIKVITYNNDGEATIHTCKWKPYKPQNYPSHKLPSEGYLGTAEVIEGSFEGIGYHCWQQNNSDFLYYCLL